MGGLWSVDTWGKEEVLDDWNDLDLTEVEEQLIELLLRGAVQDQIGPEYKDSSR